MGDEQFVKQMFDVETNKNIQGNALNNTNSWQEIGLKPWHAARLPVTEYLSQTGLARNEANLAAITHGAYSMNDTASGVGLHYTTLSKVVQGNDKSRPRIIILVNNRERIALCCRLGQERLIRLCGE